MCSRTNSPVPTPAGFAQERRPTTAATKTASTASACGPAGRLAPALRSSTVLNIRSMRSVIRKPPTAFVDEQVTAMKPRSVHTQPLGTWL